MLGVADAVVGMVGTVGAAAGVPGIVGIDGADAVAEAAEGIAGAADGDGVVPGMLASIDAGAAAPVGEGDVPGMLASIEAGALAGIAGAEGDAGEPLALESWPEGGGAEISSAGAIDGGIILSAPPLGTLFAAEGEGALAETAPPVIDAMFFAWFADDSFAVSGILEGASWWDDNMPYTPPPTTTTPSTMATLTSIPLSTATGARLPPSAAKGSA